MKVPVCPTESLLKKPLWIMPLKAGVLSALRPMRSDTHPAHPVMEESANPPTQRSTVLLSFWNVKSKRHPKISQSRQYDLSIKITNSRTFPSGCSFIFYCLPRLFLSAYFAPMNTQATAARAASSTAPMTTGKPPIFIAVITMFISASARMK